MIANVGQYGRLPGFGEDAAAMPESDYSAYLDVIAPYVEKWWETSAYQKVVEARAALQLAVAKGSPAKVLSDLRAQLAAAEREYALEVEAESSSREWSALAKVGAVVGIGIGVAILVRVALG